jgi:hypothetical protein
LDKTISLILITIFISACATWRKGVESNGDKNQAIQNIILDYTRTEGTRENEVYYITQEPEQDNQFHF